MKAILARGLRAVIVGTRGRTSSPHTEHFYDGAGNQFYRLLFDSGLTPRQLRADEDELLLQFGIGVTDLVYTDGDPDLALLHKQIRRARPVVVAFVSKTAASAYAGETGQRRPQGYGALSWTVAGRPAFVLPGPSGANNAMPIPLRAAMWSDLGDFIAAMS